MSNLFKLSRIFNEVSSPNILKTVPMITYLSEGINILRETEEKIQYETDRLYSSVLEADSRNEENNKFADFFKEYQSTITDYIFKIKKLASEFAINIETFADANKDICDRNNTNIVSTITYKGAKYSHLLDDDIPDIDPYKVFKKEFAFIGKLLQDLGPVGSEDQKAHIIATVCNNLSKEINDGWMDKVIEKITDCDDCKKDEFAKAIYKTFVPEPSVDMEVDIGLVKQSKLDILNYKQYVDCVSKSVDEFTDGLSRIASEVGSMFFRNKDHKLPITTDVDGVEDKTYRLNDQSFSQMNIFISTKISQITELCNLFMVAISIKMDCIMKYMQQCKDIIDTAAHGVDNTPNVDGVDPGDNDIDNDGTPDEDTEIPEEYDEELEEYNIDDSSEEEFTQDNSDSELEQECYLFEAIMYEKERAINRYVQKQYVYEEVLTEAPKAVQTVEAFIDSIIEQIRKLIRMMKERFSKNYEPVIQSIKANRNILESKTPPPDWTTDTLNHEKLKEAKLANFNGQTDPTLLSEKKNYYMERYRDIIVDKTKAENASDSAKDILLESMKLQENVPYNQDQLKNSISFIADHFTPISNAITTMANALPNQKSIARQFKYNSTAGGTQPPKQQQGDQAPKTGEGAGSGGEAKPAAKEESAYSIFTLDNTMQMYFEADSAEVPADTPNMVNRNEVPKLYFRYNSEMITALMNINTMLMKKHLNFVNKIAVIAGVQLNKPTIGKKK